MNTWHVTKQVKLLPFLQQQLKSTSANRAVKRQIELGKCKVNGMVERFASRDLEGGDRVEFDASALAVEEKKPEFEKARILFEDDHLLIYDKPPRVSSDPQGLLALLKPHGNFYLTHRLDKDTSGVIILAKTKAIEEKLFDEFKKREVEKEYLAVVDGSPKDYEGVIQNFLGPLRKFQGQTIYGRVPEEKGGLFAKTAWRLSKSAKNAAVITCKPETGRTHQIRVHLSGMGHPILGDDQYGKKFRSPYRPNRMLLFASKASFKHPVTQERITVEAPLPEDFKKAYKALWQ